MRIKFSNYAHKSLVDLSAAERNHYIKRLTAEMNDLTQDHLYSVLRSVVQQKKSAEFVHNQIEV